MKHHFRPPELTLTTILVGLAICLYGCSSSYTVSSAGKPNAEYSYQEMNKELKERHASIELIGGQEVPAKNVKISDDSVSWIDPQTNEESGASTERINKIVIKDHLLGAFEGLGIGLVGAGGLGALLGNVLVKTSEDKSLGTGVGLIIGGGAGVIFGLMAGAGIGHSYNYEFQEGGRADSSRKTLIEESSAATDVLDLKKAGTEKEK